MAQALKAQGNAAFKEGRYDQAVGYFSEAIDHDNTNAVLFSNRSGAYASLGQYESALKDAQKAVPHPHARFATAERGTVIPSHVAPAGDAAAGVGQGVRMPRAGDCKGARGAAVR